MNKKALVIIIVVICGLIGLLIWAYLANIPQPNPAVDAFAQCLSKNNVVMYGAYWCPHCKKQKELFGTSFAFVNYVECTQDIKICKEKKIKGYPTWIFKDGSRIEGEATFKTLAEKTFCKAP